MQIRNKKTISLGIGIAIALVIVGSVGALNGWFGGGSSIPSDTMTRGLVGYWSMDEGSGTTTFDGSGSNNTGYFQTAASSPKWASGKVSGALEFDGKDDYVNCGTDGSLNLWERISIELWAYTDPTNNDGTLAYLLSKQNVPGTNGYGIYWEDRVGQDGLRVVLGTSSPAAVTPLTSAGWNHFAVSWDKDENGGALYVYLNGALETGTTTHTSVIASASNVLVIGSGLAGGASFFNGLIDEVRIYNRALSAEEIRYHYNRGGPVAHWTFDEGNGTTTYDSTNNGNDGYFTTAASSPTWTTGKYGSALNFDGTDDYVGITSSQIQGLVADDTKSISAWIKLNTDTAVERRVVAIHKQYNATRWGLGWARADANKKLYVSYNNGDTHSQLYSQAEYDSSNGWIHLAGVQNGTSIKIYINGVEDNSANDAATIAVGSSADSCIGCYLANVGDYRNIWNGLIDDVRIYGYARTPDEIRLDYNAGFAARFGPQSSCDNDPGACMDKGLVGYWNFEEGGGTTTFDGSDSSNDGYFQTTASSPSWATGVKSLSGGVSGGQALSFDGDDVISLPVTGVSATGKSQITLSFWFKSNSWANDGTDILYSEEVGSNYWRFTINTQDASNLRFWTRDISSGDSGAEEVLSFAKPSLGVWHNLVALYDASGGNKQVFIDGVSVAQTSSSVNSFTATAANFIGIGRDTRSWRGFDGLIDEVRIYNRALSAEEVRYHYNRGGPVAHWKFDEGNGTTTYDSVRYPISNNGYFQTTASSPTWTTGKYGTALSFDGTDDYVDAGNQSDFQNLTSAFTVEAWVYPTSLSGENAIAGKLNDNGVNRRQWMVILDSSAKPTIYGSSDGTHANSNALRGTPISVNDWYHIAATVNGSQWKIYVDGNLDASRTASFSAFYSNTQDNFNIGRVASPDRYFDGSIDEVRIYNYARTADEIRQDYNAGFAAHFGGNLVSNGNQVSCDLDPGACIDMGLVGYWNFEEGGGTTTFDGSDYYNNGNFQTAASSPSWATGVKSLSGGVSGGQALSFDGKDDYVNTSDIDFTTGAIELWVKPTVTPATNVGFVSKRGASDADIPFQVGMILNTLKVRAIVEDGGLKTADSVNEMRLNEWNHIVGVIESGNTIKIYLNGNLENSTAIGTPDTNNYRYKIGCSGAENSCNAYYNFNGSIDEVRIYNRALSAEEVRYHYNRGGPMAHWTFDEGIGTTTFDGTPNGNDGFFQTAASSPTWVQGKYGSALQFDGTDDYVDLGMNKFANLNEGTIMAWVKPIGTGSQGMIFFADGTYVALFEIENGRLHWATNVGGWNPDAYGNTTIQYNQWYHAVIMVNSSGYKFYLNGILDGSGSSTNFLNDLSGTQLNYIGRDPSEWYGGGREFNGYIDEVRIYNYARTPEQIQKDYNMGLGTHFK